MNNFAVNSINTGKKRLTPCFLETDKRDGKNIWFDLKSEFANWFLLCTGSIYASVDLLI